MFNDTYVYNIKQVPTSYDILSKTLVSSSYYYGDKATWNSSTNKYELTIDDGNGNDITPTSATSWSSIQSHAQGMFTCKSTTATSCSTVYYIVANSSNSYMYSLPLSNNENINKTISWTIGSGYTENNGVYSLTGTSTLTISLKDWYTNYSNSNYVNYYTCDDFNSTTCNNDLYYIGSTSENQIFYDKHSNNYTYANDVQYVSGEYKFVLDDITNKPYKNVWKWGNEYNTLTSTHYTCFGNYNELTNSCGGTIYYIYYASDNSAYYVELTNGEKIENVLNKMLNTSNSSSSNINKYNSTIKSVVDSWYESNISNLSSYLDDNAVFCNDRTINGLNGWSPTGDLTNIYLKFKYINAYNKSNASLVCSNITDRFSKNNTNIAELKYPIGLLSQSEVALMTSNYAVTGYNWWTLSPIVFEKNAAIIRYVNVSGGNSSYNVRFALGIRPAIVLKPSVAITGGDGTYNTPYIIDTSS